MAKTIDRLFLQYGVRDEDMQIIEQSCMDNEIDAEWMKSFILAPYQELRTNGNTVEEKEVRKLLKNALRNLPQ
ncbi:MAG: hypothetical protein J6Y99_00810 [Bacteroidales bacterium]|jgi:hypothetical protein|nr:hypothetical protein [Bacteroidales bacterium]